MSRNCNLRLGVIKRCLLRRYAAES
jgi:hypothetical protein